MVSKHSCAALLLLIVSTAEAQGVVSSVAGQVPSSTETATATATPTPAKPALTGVNPFLPPSPAPDTSAVNATTSAEPPPPPPDPVLEAIASELRQIREQGERIGVIDGKVIFRHQGRYLIEALPKEGENPRPAHVTLPETLTDECVIRVVPANAGPTPGNNPNTTTNENETS